MADLDVGNVDGHDGDDGGIHGAPPERSSSGKALSHEELAFMRLHDHPRYVEAVVATAEAYEDLGIKVLTLNVDKSSRGRWKRLVEAEREERVDKVREAAESACEFLFGGVPGDQYLVFDVDDEQQFAQLTVGLNIDLTTSTVDTPSGGRQMWFANVDGLAFKDLGKLGELRTGDGCYCVLPGSGVAARYTKGRDIEAPYRWRPSTTPLTQLKGPLRPFPMQLASLLDAVPPPRASRKGTAAETGTAVGFPRHSADGKGVRKGQRNITIFKKLCGLRAKGVDEETALKVATDIAQSCEPPYPVTDEDENPENREPVEAILARVWDTYPAGAKSESDTDQAAARQDVEALLEGVRTSRDATVVFDNVADLAALPVAEYAKAKVQLKDLLTAKLNLNDLDRAVRDARRRASSLPIGSLPTIVLSDDKQLRDKSREAVAALNPPGNDPFVFSRGDDLVEILQVGAEPAHLRVLDTAGLCAVLTRAADFYQPTKNGLKAVTPPADVVADILARPERFHQLHAVVDVPILRPDGSICTTPGYDAATGVAFCPPPGVRMPSIPQVPTASDVAQAVALIDELFVDFTFADEASRANAFALLVTATTRTSIDGHVPLTIIDAPKAGSGKTLLATCVGIIANGQAPGMLQYAEREEEIDKRLTAVLREGKPFIVFDNVDTELNSAVLAGALTATRHMGRILGLSAMVDVPQRAVFVATGNNVRVGGDMPRRCVWCRLDPMMADPWRRTGFQHDPLETWVKAHRMDLVAAVLTLVRAWIAAGRPAAPKSVILGSFQEWVRTVGGILSHAGMRGFLGNIDIFQARQGEDAGDWQRLLRLWHSLLGSDAATVSDVIAAIGQRTDAAEFLQSVLGKDAHDPVAAARAFGRACSDHEETRYGDDNIRVVRDGKRQNRVLWRAEMDTPVEQQSLDQNGVS